MTDNEKLSLETFEGVFNDDSTDEAPPEPEKEEVEAKEVDEIEEVEQEKGVEVDETSDAEPPAAEKGSESSMVAGLKAALKAERQKRQEIASKVNEYKRKYEPDTEAPDPVEDPEAYEKYVENKVRYRDYEQRADESRSAMMIEKDDYEDMETVFIALSQKDKSLSEALAKHPEPARFAYEKGKAYMESLVRKVIPETQAKDVKPKSLAAAKVPNLNKAVSESPVSTYREKTQSLGEMFSDQKY